MECCRMKRNKCNGQALYRFLISDSIACHDVEITDAEGGMRLRCTLGCTVSNVDFFEYLIESSYSCLINQYGNGLVNINLDCIVVYHFCLLTAFLAVPEIQEQIKGSILIGW